MTLVALDAVWSGTIASIRTYRSSGTVIAYELPGHNAIPWAGNWLTFGRGQLSWKCPGTPQRRGFFYPGDYAVIA
jgi:hypothetical protein